MIKPTLNWIHFSMNSQVVFFPSPTACWKMCPTFQQRATGRGRGTACVCQCFPTWTTQASTRPFWPSLTLFPWCKLDSWVCAELSLCDNNNIINIITTTKIDDWCLFITIIWNMFIHLLYIYINYNRERGLYNYNFLTVWKDVSLCYHNGQCYCYLYCCNLQICLYITYN